MQIRIELLSGSHGFLLALAESRRRRSSEGKEEVGKDTLGAGNDSQALATISTSRSSRQSLSSSNLDLPTVTPTRTSKKATSSQELFDEWNACKKRCFQRLLEAVRKAIARFARTETGTETGSTRSTERSKNEAKKNTNTDIANKTTSATAAGTATATAIGNSSGYLGGFGIGLGVRPASGIGSRSSKQPLTVGECATNGVCTFRCMGACGDLSSYVIIPRGEFIAGFGGEKKKKVLVESKRAELVEELRKLEMTCVGALEM